MLVGSLLCVDVGSSKICAVIANVGEGRVVDVIGVGRALSQGVQKGIIVDIGDAASAIREAVEQVEGGAPKVGRVLVGFSGKHVTSSNPMVSVHTGRTNNVVNDSALREAERSLRGIAFPEDRVTVNIVKRHYAIDRVGVIKNPLGMHGHRLDMEAHVITADYGYMENLRACLQRAGVGVSIDNFVANPLAAGEAVLEPEDKERGVILADIGGGTTGIGVFREGSIWHTLALPVGGKQITNDLAVGLGIPFSAAEELKVKAGTLYPEEAPEATAEMTGGYKTSPEELSYVIRARVEEILRMIVSKSPYVPNVLVLTGGTAKLPGMEQFAREVLGLQVRIGVPSNLPPGGETLGDPAYTAVVGLLLWGTESRVGGGDGRADLGGRPAGVFSGLRSTWSTFWNAGWRPRISFGGSKSEQS